MPTAHASHAAADAFPPNRRNSSCLCDSKRTGCDSSASHIPAPVKKTVGNANASKCAWKSGELR
eukprot:1329617-Rhodomonas_salina.3